MNRMITNATGGMEKIDGFIPLYWDAVGGKIYMEIARWDTEILYQVSLPTGVGSNPLGLDRNQLGDTRIVYFNRVGPKVLLIEPNYRYRALSDDAAERRAVEESFARSVIWGFKVEARDGNTVLVDATSFILRDAHGVIDRLRQRRQGKYRLDESRSALFMPRTKAFPKNTEIEATLTFQTDEDPGPLVRDTVPTPQSLTVRQHHSFVELPDAGYKPRRLDPRVGVFGVTFFDYASPITEPIEKRWIARHRLEKKDPSAAVSEPVNPIIYYVDNGTPEPIRSALIDGAAWWKEGFEAAGFRNAYEVRVLPEDADPMDARYNIINWVHRSTRGWSYGASITDPRTGEIIKGNVSLGSLRVRQDYLIGTGLIPDAPASSAGGGTSDTSPGDACEFGSLPDVEYLAHADPSTDSTEMSLARIRQLSAHEVGHTIGLAHNFAASTYGRASVMDYPAPLVEIKDGRLDLSNAYGVGIGEYDKFAVRYAYAQFAPGSDEAAELDRIINDGLSKGMLFISDSDARPAGAAHPLANLWDNGSDPIESLRHAMEVRRRGLETFGINSVPIGTPLFLLEAKLLPLYLHHRYQLQAAVKSLGGFHYTYAVRGPNGPSPATVKQIVSPIRQREALRAVLDTISLENLSIPDRIVDLLPPRAFGYQGGPAELFRGRTSPGFDPVAATTIAADLAVSALLQPERAARLIEFNSRGADNPHFREVIDSLLAATWKLTPPRDGRRRAMLEAVQSLVAARMMDLGADPAAAPAVRAEAVQSLRELAAFLKSPSGLRLTRSHRLAAIDDIERFLVRPDAVRQRTRPLDHPAGDPIGWRDGR